MKGNEAVAKILKKEGVEFVTTFPFVPILDTVAAEGIRVIRTRTERAAVNIADGFTRASFGNRIGVCSAQHGPGVENAFSGISHAWADSVPLLFLPGGYFRYEKVAPQFDAVPSFLQITKWADEFHFAYQVPGKMRRAFVQLRNGRPGPVMLVMPRDVAEEELDDFEYEPLKASRPAANPEEIKEVVKALLEADLPVIRAGQGCLYAEAWPELLELAELLQIPVFTTQNGKSVFPEDHPLCLGCGGASRPDAVVHFLEKADLIFSIGSSISRENFTTSLPPGMSIIQSTIDERDLAKDYIIDQLVVGDAKQVLRQIIDEVRAQGAAVKDRNGIAEEIKSVKDTWLEKWMPKLTSDEVPINPYRVITEIQNTLDEKETIVSHEAGGPRDQMVPFYRSNTPGGYIGWGKSSTLGQSLGLMMGAKLANPEKTCVAFMGDGAFGMVGMDFETAAREEIPILVIVLNNGVLGGYDKYFPVASERYGLDVHTGNYAQLAESLGGYGERVEQPDEIAAAIGRAQEAMATGKPALLDMITCEETEFSGKALSWPRGLDAVQ